MRREGAPCRLASDLLHLVGRDVCAEPLEERKGRLSDLVAGLANPAAQDTAGIVGEAKALFDLVKERGMEGLVALHCTQVS